MRCAFAVVVVFGLVWGDFLAAAEPARPPQGLGQLVVTDPQSGSPVRLNLARYQVNVVYIANRLTDAPTGRLKTNVPSCCVVYGL